eukprot:15912-Heterococcus_DN1.PRE.1
MHLANECIVDCQHTIHIAIQCPSSNVRKQQVQSVGHCICFDVSVCALSSRSASIYSARPYRQSISFLYEEYEVG